MQPRSALGLRPLSPGELVQAAVSGCAASYGAQLSAMATFLVPAFVFALAVGLLAGLVRGGQTDPSLHSAVLAGGVALAALVAGVAGALGQTAATHVALASLCGGTGSRRRAVATTWAALPTLFWVGLLYGLGVTVGCLLLVIPGIYLFVAWYAAVPVVFVEQRKGLDALRRSRSLVSGRWWAVLGTMLLLSIPIGVLTSVLDGTLTRVAGAFGSVLALVVELLVSPLSASLVAAVYLDLRLRSDGAGPAETGAALGVLPSASAHASSDAMAAGGGSWSAWHPGQSVPGTKWRAGTVPPPPWPPPGPPGPSWPPPPPPPPPPPAASETPSPSVDASPSGLPAPRRRWPDVSPKPVPPLQRPDPSGRPGTGSALPPDEGSTAEP